MNRKDLGLQFFDAKYNCAQSVVAAFTDRTALPMDTLLKAATGFGGGIGRRQLSCGAVTGAVMIIGCLYGRGTRESVDAQEEAYRVIREFMEEFRKQMGSTNCQEILGVDFSTEEGRAAYQRPEIRRLCPKAVETAIQILEEKTPK